MARNTRTRTKLADAPEAGGASPEGQHEGESPRGATAEGPVLIDLALQGGGSHGAFTWGVLDRLLQDERFRIDGVSGTSAGAMNAAVMAAGFAKGGAAGARAALDAYWRSVADAAQFSPFQRGPLDVLLGRWTLDHSPLFVTMDMMSRLFSPYDFNPTGRNPLRGILEEAIDFEALKVSPIRVFITATNVRTGRGRVFRNAEITPDVLLASACLPTLFQAVEIDGESYWDGGYSGNPTITPLVRECQSHDTILIPINPVERPGTPETAPRHHEPPQRDLVQFRAAEGIAHDRHAAPGRRSRAQRGRAMGADAHPPGAQRDHGDARLFLEAERRMAVPLDAAR